MSLLHSFLLTRTVSCYLIKFIAMFKKETVPLVCSSSRQTQVHFWAAGRTVAASITQPGTALPLFPSDAQTLLHLGKGSCPAPAVLSQEGRLFNLAARDQASGRIPTFCTLRSHQAGQLPSRPICWSRENLPLRS